MAGDIVQFVDSIASSPTVRLDVNTGLNPWICRSITADPPRLRRAMSQNAMRDGVHVSSSQYDARTVVLELECVTSTQDLGATQLQTLARELDRADNFLKWQPNGATKPVFFKLFRSDISAIRDVPAASAYRTVQVELLAEPFALGLREDAVTSVTMTNNPAAGSNGLYIDTPTILGDVPTPALIQANTLRGLSVAIASEASPAAAIYFQQCESATAAQDTSNPGGAADAAMSGAGTTNYLRTTFASVTTMSNRVTGMAITDLKRGRYRAFVRVRRSDATSVMGVRLGIAPTTGGAAERYLDTKTLPLSTTPQLIDLGIVDYPGGIDIAHGLGAGAVAAATFALGFQLGASRTSGTGTLDWDYLWLAPASQTLMLGTMPDNGAGYPTLLDDATDQVFGAGTGFPAGPIAIHNQLTGASAALRSGSLPHLRPGVANRIHAAALSGAVTATQTWWISYWPQYLYVRPSAT